ncbi:MAG: type III pantothenate kinase [Eubacterium sp.]|nr:type III pantothenate kinase [Eubacterium sp.]
MLLVIDVGNTNITLGLLEGKDVVATFRLTSQSSCTSDEYGSQIAEMIEKKGHDIKDIEDVVISSVVPKVMYSLNSGIIKYFGIEPMIVGIGTKTGIKINRTDPREVGSDRIVDAVAAYELYGGPCIVMDFGTATTIDLIGPEGTFDAGVTAPGIRISAQALWNETARLPEVEIKKPKTILATDTIMSMQAGIVYGQIGQAQYIINKMKEECNYDDIKVIASGGLGKIIYENTDFIDVYDQELTLQGMRIIYEKNKNK